MGYNELMKRGELDLDDFIGVDGLLTIRATPGAASNRISLGAVLKVGVTSSAQNGKANKAITDLLAKAFGIPRSSLILVRGETARNKVFRVER